MMMMASAIAKARRDLGYCQIVRLFGSFIFCLVLIHFDFNMIGHRIFCVGGTHSISLAIVGTYVGRHLGM